MSELVYHELETRERSFSFEIHSIDAKVCWTEANRKLQNNSKMLKEAWANVLNFCFALDKLNFWTVGRTFKSIRQDVHLENLKVSLFFLNLFKFRCEIKQFSFPSIPTF